MASEPPVEDPIETNRSPLDIKLLLSDGIEGVLSVTGGQLVAVLSVIGIVGTVLTQTLFASVLESMLTYARENIETIDPELQSAIAEAETLLDSMGLALDVSPIVALGGLVVVAVASEAVMIAGVRAFGDGALDGVPTDLATRRIAITTLFGFVGGIVLWIAIGIGLILLLVPGVFVYVGTIFFRQEVAIADEGPLAAISASWARTKGNRWTLLAIAVVLWIVGYVASFLGGFVPGLAGTVAGTVLSSVTGVFAMAVLTSAYVGLRNTERDHATDPASTRS
ncbi:MAG: hypothetical protein ABEI98_01345 [Halorhabdus sp.]